MKTGAPGVKGPIAAGVVPGVLSGIYLGRRTGMLRFIRGEERRSVRFMSGHIVYGEASMPSLRLGPVLVAAGRLDPTLHERARTVVDRERKRLGAVLMEMGVLDENGLEQALALHVRTILASVFSLRDGTYTFQEQDPEAFLDDDWPLAISTAEAVLGAVRAVHGRDDVRFALGEVGRVLIASDDPLVLYQRMDLGPAEAAVLGRVDGTRSGREVLAASGLGDTEGERALFALLCTGILQFGGEAAPVSDAATTADRRQEVLEMYRSLPRRADHELLGVPPQATAAEIKAAYFRLAKRFHPDVVHEPGLGDLGDEMEAVFFRLNDVFRAMSARVVRASTAPASGPATARPAAPRKASSAPAAAPRAEAPPPTVPPDFEAALHEGRERLAEGKSWEAAMAFEDIARSASGRMRTRARVLLGRALLQLADREKAAEKALQEAVKEDPAHVEAHYLLGTLYRRRGLTTRAASMFRKALEVDPGHRASLAEMDALAAEPAPPRAGRASRRA